MVLKFIGTIFIVALIFFGSFLAYIVFNPSQAQFFVNFGINPNDVALFLGKLVNAIFGIIVLLTSILWIILLFRALWTAKDLKRKRLLRWLLSGFVGIILFSCITLWAYLVQTINATDYSNPGGTVLLYDHALWSEETFRDQSQIFQTSELIGPVTVLFDISANAKLTEDKNLFTIESFAINFDGAKCADGSTVVTGKSPKTDKTIICTFDKIQVYNPQGKYIGRDRNGEPKEINMFLPSIEIRGLVDIKKQRNKDNKNIITFDASGLRNLGKILWIYDNKSQVEQPSITEVEWEIARYVCLQVIRQNGCDRVFVIGASRDQENIGKIVWDVDPGNSLLYHFRIDKLTLDENEITRVEWILDNRSIMCNENETTCSYLFDSYGKKQVQTKITLASGEAYPIDYELIIEEPIKLARKLRVYDEAWVQLNKEDTYDANLRAYVIKDLAFPATIKFDARDIVPSQSGYKLEKVEWNISNTKSDEQKIGETLDLDIIEATRYTIHATYTFVAIQWTEKKTSIGKDAIIIDTESKNLIPILSIDQSSDYLPVTVRVDASASRTKNGEIKKFIYNFWEWRAPVEWDSQQTYEYISPGEKTITLTIVSSTGEKESTKRQIVIKEAQRVVDFLPSVSPGVVGIDIDFMPRNITGQVEEYIWNFWDGTPTVRTMNPSHIFTRSWKYTVSLTVRYSDGTQRSETREYLVEGTAQ